MDSRHYLEEIKEIKKETAAVMEKFHVRALEEALRKLVGGKTDICFCMPDDDIRELLPLMARSTSYLLGGSEFLQDDTLHLIFPDGEIATACWHDICDLFDIQTQIVDASDLKQMSIPYSDRKADILEKIYERFISGEFLTKEDIFAELIA